MVTSILRERRAARLVMAIVVVLVVAAALLFVYMAVNAGETEHSCPEPRETRYCE